MDEGMHETLLAVIYIVLFLSGFFVLLKRCMRDQINHVPDRCFTTNECPICLMKMNKVSNMDLHDCSNPMDTKILACGHCFHKECIDRWLRRKKACPVCKMSV